MYYESITFGVLGWREHRTSIEDQCLSETSRFDYSMGALVR